MKTLAIVLFASSVAVAACPAGTVENAGTCAAMPSPADQTLAPMVGVMSDEKPPRHPEPAYERGEVKADMGTRAKEPDIAVENNAKAEKAQQ